MHAMRQYIVFHSSGGNDRNPQIVYMLYHQPSTPSLIPRLDKMATFSQRIFSDAFREWQIFYFDKKKSLKFVPKGPIDNNPGLV